MIATRARGVSVRIFLYEYWRDDVVMRRSLAFHSPQRGRGLASAVITATDAPDFNGINVTARTTGIIPARSLGRIRYTAFEARGSESAPPDRPASLWGITLTPSMHRHKGRVVHKIGISVDEIRTREWLVLHRDACQQSLARTSNGF